MAARISAVSRLLYRLGFLVTATASADDMAKSFAAFSISRRRRRNEFLRTASVISFFAAL